MKFKTTKKSVMDGYEKVIKVPYCELQHTLDFERPVAYTTNIDGWCADVYEVDNLYNVAIVTGRAPFGHIHVRFETTQKYEEQAHGASRERRLELIHEFIREVLSPDYAS